jgi:hypothetical protein
MWREIVARLRAGDLAPTAEFRARASFVAAAHVAFVGARTHCLRITTARQLSVRLHCAVMEGL